MHLEKSGTCDLHKPLHFIGLEIEIFFPAADEAGIADGQYSADAGRRALGVAVSDFSEKEQLTLFGDAEEEEKEERLDAAVQKMREKYGNRVLQRATVLGDKRLAEMDIKGAHIIHPEGHRGDA